MIWIALAIAAQTAPDPPPGYKVDPNPYAQFAPKPERLGPGPHTLIVATPNGQTVTRTDFKTGVACQHAKDEVLRQVARPISATELSSPVVVFCLPRER